MSNFSVTVGIDNDTAEVLLESRNTSALNAGYVRAELDPKQARKIAIALLQIADEADAQAIQNARRAASV